MNRAVSIVVNTYNRAESLRRTLESFRGLDHRHFEVVVVNGPSNDGTIDMLEEYRGQIKVGHCGELNLSASRNVGIALAAGDFVAFMDDDAYPDPAWLDEVLPAFDNDEVAAAGGPVFDYTGAAFQARSSVANRMGDASVNFDSIPGDEFDSPFSDQFVYTIGTNAVFRRDRLLEVGGFDEEYEYYLDETDLCRRLIDRGYVVRALPRGFVYHKFLASHMRSASRANWNRYPVLKNRLYFALRHGLRSSSAFDVHQAFGQFAEGQRLDIRWNVDHGLLSPADLDRLEVDIRRAYDDAHAHFEAGPPRTRDVSWFAAQALPFHPFPDEKPERRLHVCFIIQEYPPDPVSGIARFVHALAVAMAARGHVVRVLTRGQDHDRVDLEQGVWVHRFVVTPHEQPEDLAVPRHIWDYSASALDELRRIQSIRPIDVVQSPNWDVEGIAVHLAGEFLSVLSLHTPVRTVSAIDGRVRLDDIGNQQIVDLEHRLFEESDGFLANAPSVIGEIERRYDVILARDRLEVVAHGLLDEPSSPVASNAEPEILFVGRLERRKGIDVLLAALPMVLDAAPTARVSIVGNDTITDDSGFSYRELFEKSVDGARLADRVTFTGLISEDLLPIRYANCDIFVAPSRYESFGLVVLEAMRAGKPVVATDVGGMAGLIVPGENGYLVPPEDPIALATALADLLSDASRRRAFGARSRERFVSHYSASRMAEETERFYWRLVASRKDQSTVSR